MTTLQATGQLIARLTDAYEIIADEDAVHQECGTSTPAKLAECVPLLAIAMELIDRGPAALTIEGIENYRTKVMALLEHIRPAVEREATLMLENWTSQLLAA